MKLNQLPRDALWHIARCLGDDAGDTLASIRLSCRALADAIDDVVTAEPLLRKIAVWVERIEQCEPGCKKPPIDRCQILQLSRPRPWRRLPCIACSGAPLPAAQSPLSADKRPDLALLPRCARCGTLCAGAMRSIFHALRVGADRTLGRDEILHYPGGDVAAVDLEFGDWATLRWACYMGNAGAVRVLLPALELPAAPVVTTADAPAPAPAASPVAPANAPAAAALIQNCYPLVAAAHGGHLEVIRLLIEDMEAREAAARAAGEPRAAAFEAQLRGEMVRARAAAYEDEDAGVFAILPAAAAGAPLEVVQALVQFATTSPEGAAEEKPVDGGSAAVPTTTTGPTESRRLVSTAITAGVKTALVAAASQGRLGVIRWMLDSAVPGASVAGDAVLTAACAGGHAETVKFLIDLPRSYGVQVSSRASSAGARRGGPKVVELLLNLTGDRALRFARALPNGGYEGKAEGERGVRSGDSARSMAIEANDLESVRLFAARGCPFFVNAPYDVYIAAMYGRGEMIKLLLELEGPSFVRMSSAEFNDAAYEAERNGFPEIVDLIRRVERERAEREAGQRTN
jgi:hypothetical protein